ncbi:unnamed protein product [Amoebophrya sp. A25]|nr:unnamed protein product [Amoebophrya sp. A25]|eukprot:GSA25T00002844001.1
MSSRFRVARLELRVGGQESLLQRRKHKCRSELNQMTNFSKLKIQKKIKVWISKMRLFLPRGILPVVLFGTASSNFSTVTALGSLFLSSSSSSKSSAQLEEQGLSGTSLYPPETCSCACCVVVQEGPHLGCDVPKPSHWKHQACTFALCGNGQVLADKGPEYAAKQKRAFCVEHCGVPEKGGRGDTCSCKNGAEDPWSCPHGEK